MKSTKASSVTVTRLARGCFLGVIGTVALGALASGCLDRPVAPASPKTSNVVSAEIPNTRVDKIDLLFMIDNSTSMADKQEILALAVPDLVQRLVNPVCVSETDPTAASQKPDADGNCPAGTAREFDPIVDIHIGVVTSSLGGQGADTCSPTDKNYQSKTPDDRGEMLTRVSKVNTTDPDPSFYKDHGFFAWDPKGRYSAADHTYTSAEELEPAFQAVVKGAGEIGCGYEASLEAWYRFLVDPVPPNSVALTDPYNINASAIGQGTNETILAQRADFLRPDSLLAVILLSDENDCSLAEGSVKTGGQNFPAHLALRAGYFTKDPNTGADVANTFLMAPGTDACAADPNSADCKSCFVDGDAPGCKDEMGNAKRLTRQADASGTPPQDPLNLKCFDQKRRFGVDGLFPIERYVRGLTRRHIVQRVLDENGNTKGFEIPDEIDKEGEETAANNPIFIDKEHDEALAKKKELDQQLKDGKIKQSEYDKQYKPYKAAAERSSKARDTQKVFLGMIVGVPWQDLAVDPEDLSKGFRKVADFESPLASIQYPEGQENPFTQEFTTWDLIVGPEGGALGRLATLKAATTKNKLSEADLSIEYVTPTPPLDPLMQERRDPIASAEHPITKEAIGGNDTWNRINGHEWNANGESTLQFACIMPLPAEVNCDDPNLTGNCDCTYITASDPDGGTKAANPLCAEKEEGNSPYANVQRRAKAFPGSRQLQVLREFSLFKKENAIAASVCVDNVTDTNRADFGYRPAVAAIIDRLKEQLTGKCFERPLSVNLASEQSPKNAKPEELLYRADCLIIAASRSADNGGECKACDASTGRAKVPSDVEKALTGPVTDYDCKCEVNQFNGAALRECVTNPNRNLSIDGDTLRGWCYVDLNHVPKSAEEGAGSILSKCDEGNKHNVRFVGMEFGNDTLFLTCLGAAAGTDLVDLVMRATWSNEPS